MPQHRIKVVMEKDQLLQWTNIGNIGGNLNP